MPLKVTNLTRDRILADQAREATRFGARFLGLMGRTHFPFGHGLWITPCNSIHTFFMRLPIDALFLSRDLQVVKAFDALRPWRATSIYRRAAGVLELPAGTVHASGTLEGDQLAFDRTDGRFDPPLAPL